MTPTRGPGFGLASLFQLGADRESRGYFVLCALLVLSMLASVIVPERGWSGTILDACLVAILGSAGYSAVDSRKMLAVVLVLGLLAFSMAALRALGDEEAWSAPAFFAIGVFLAVVNSALLVDVITAGQGRGVSHGLIAGAISVYLLMAVTFSVWYRFALSVNPEAFAGAVDAESGLHINSMLYFSFVTLTTVGYGDITPVGGGVRMLAIFEALAGQLYLTLLVARLVGIQIAHSPSRDG